MKNINVRLFVSFAFGVFAVCFVVVVCATGANIHNVSSALIVAYKTIPILLMAWTIFVLYAWKWRIFRGWLVKLPYLDGTWRGSIRTTWKNSDTDECLGPIPVLLTIRQTFCRISCVMRSNEMTSSSYCADFWIDDDEQIFKLAYCYTSKPTVLVLARSVPHDGAVLFEIIGDPVQKLKGTYWTTRKTTGEITLTLICRKRLDDLPDDFGCHPMEGE